MQVNGKGGNSTPTPSETPEPIVTKICMGNYVGDTYPMQNFITIRLPPFAPQICENAHQATRLVFFGSSDSLQPRPLHRFSRSIRHMTRFRARICLLGVLKILNLDPIFPQKRKFFADFRRHVKKALTMAMLPCKLPLIVIVAQ